tara:strand:- start:5489 stop:5734 length:246 start_codon:yes stop_codon:yes gene_type:complete
MARQGGFLVGPSIHNTSKLRKHKLKRGVTRDMNNAAGVPVNTKNMVGYEAFRYAPTGTKAIGPRHGKTLNPRPVKRTRRRR